MDGGRGVIGQRKKQAYDGKSDKSRSENIYVLFLVLKCALIRRDERPPPAVTFTLCGGFSREAIRPPAPLLSVSFPLYLPPAPSIDEVAAPGLQAGNNRWMPYDDGG